MDRDYTYKLLRCAYNVFDELGPGLFESIYEEGAYNLNDTSPYTADSAYADTTDGTLQEEKDDIRNNKNGIEDEKSEEEISE